MAEIEKKPVKVVETILRDAHQSLIATRMSTEQMLPIIEKLDKVGYYAVECWGGATFDASLRFLKEDPWERLRKLRDGFKNTKLQMLFRGQNILGYRPYADDVVEYFVQKSIANGIDIIRIFDCLNDIRNLSRQDYRKQFGMVLQDAWLFEGTIKENLRFGNLEATDEEIVEAAKAANVDHFIRTLPGGYNMEMNQESSNISLGQKQLLTIARALLKDAPLLILDEATSSVDTLSLIHI